MVAKARKTRSDSGVLKEGKPTVSYADVLEDAPESFALAYKQSRAWESQQKARYFRLKNDRITGRLLDRGLLERAVGDVFAAVKSIILASGSLNAKARRTLLDRLASCVELQLAQTEPVIEQAPAPFEQPPEGWSKYQFERLNEIYERSENFRLRNQRLEDESLERAPLTHDLKVITEAIVQTAVNSSLSRQDKIDACTNLARLAGVFDHVAQQQNAPAVSRGDDSNGGNGEERIDFT
jgi:hypothetical protein